MYSHFKIFWTLTDNIWRHNKLFRLSSKTGAGSSTWKQSTAHRSSSSSPSVRPPSHNIPPRETCWQLWRHRQPGTCASRPPVKNDSSFSFSLIIYSERSVKTIITLIILILLPMIILQLITTIIICLWIVSDL